MYHIYLCTYLNSYKYVYIYICVYITYAPCSSRSPPSRVYKSTITKQVVNQEPFDARAGAIGHEVDAPVEQRTYWKGHKRICAGFAPFPCPPPLNFKLSSLLSPLPSLRSPLPSIHSLHSHHTCSATVLRLSTECYTLGCTQPLDMSHIYHARITCHPCITHV